MSDKRVRSGGERAWLYGWDRGRPDEVRGSDSQVVVERPVGERPRRHRAGRERERARRDARYEALCTQHPSELQLVLCGERLVTAQRVGACGAALDHAPQLAAEGDAEIEGGADPLRRERQAVTRGVAGEEHISVDSLPELVGDPV